MSSTQIALLTAQADALASSHPDIPREKLLGIAAQVLGSVDDATPTRTQRTRKEVTPECRCCARIWGTGSGNDQCAKAKMAGSDYCKAHAAKVAQAGNCEPCQLSDSGKRIGLFTGDIRQPIPCKDSKGLWVITWNNQQLQELMATEKEQGTFQFHPWAPNSGEKALAKKASAPKKPRAPKPSNKSTKPSTRKPRGKNAYMFFLAQNRTAIKEHILQAHADDPQFKITVAHVAKEAGARWKLLNDEQKAPFEELASKDKLEKLSLWEANNSSSTPTASPPPAPPSTPDVTSTPTSPPAAPQKTSTLDSVLDSFNGSHTTTNSDEDDDEEEELTLVPYTNEQTGEEYYLYVNDNGDKWIISQEQGDADECDPEQFTQIGSWAGDPDDPTDIHFHDD